MNLPTDEELRKIADEMATNRLLTDKSIAEELGFYEFAPMSTATAATTAYAVAKLEDLRIMRDGMPFLQHKPECIVNWKKSGALPIDIPECTCGFSTHLQQLRSLLGIQS